MPTMLLYNEAGLKLFEDITYLEEYYLTNAEIEVLNHHADRIADRIGTGSQLIELGSGYGIRPFLRPPALWSPCPTSLSVCIYQMRVADEDLATFVKLSSSYMPLIGQGKMLIITH